MPIKYYITKNLLRKGEFHALTLAGPTFTLHDAIVNILQETALTESEIHGVASAVVRQRDEALLRGQTVDFGPLGTYSLRVRAVVEHSNAPLPADATVVVHFSLPRQHMKALRNRATLERVMRAPSQPVVNTFLNATTQERNTTYIAGHAARLIGDFLSFDASDPEQGVFFVAEDGTSTRAVSYLSTGNKRVDFSVPIELTGPQSVEVRTRRKAESALLASDLLDPLMPA